MEQYPAQLFAALALRFLLALVVLPLFACQDLP
jgi:hypothetical protein